MDDKTIIFIEKANKIHNRKYNYDKVKYINAKEKIIINCLKHGDFLQTPNNHLNGKTKFKEKTTEQFIIEAIKIHGNEYNYDKVNYIDNSTKIEIICKIHESFFQRPSDHLNGKNVLNVMAVQNWKQEIS